MNTKIDKFDNFAYHNTWKLLNSYRDVIMSLELSTQQIRTKFQLEYGESIDDFVELMYIAGVDLSGTNIESHTRTVERSRKMISIIDSAVDLLQARHKHGERYYWILYYTFLSPQEMVGAEAIVEKLRTHIKDMSPRTYFRQKKLAVDALSSILWGYDTKNLHGTLGHFISDEK